MEQTALITLPSTRSYIDFEEITSTAKPFMEANTEEYTLQQVRKDHTIPCFAKDNEPLISHCDFIDAANYAVSDIFKGEVILRPNIRLSHPIKGRVPEAKEKAAKDLLEHEKAIYFERMAFIIEIPSISDTIDGNKLSLTVGGVKAYNLDNLHNKSGADQNFKIFIGFKNSVCTNLCIWSDGLKADLKVKNFDELKNAIYSLFQDYQAAQHINKMKALANYHLTEKQFVQLIGRCKLYNYLPPHIKADIPLLQFGDTQISTVCKDYYRDDSFCREDDGSINLWKLYNLFTGANKSSYIDTFLDRSVNAFDFISQISDCISHKGNSWFLK
jgi:hypothetical protein